jgi:hypothetical protein
VTLQEAATVAALVVPALGLAATWGSLNNRMRAVEGVAAKLEGLQTKVTEIDSRTTSSAASQGERIGKAQAAVDHLAGLVEGIERGFALSAKRLKTAAHGNPLGDKG